MIAVANICSFLHAKLWSAGTIGNVFGLPSQNWLGDKPPHTGAITAVAIWKKRAFHDLLPCGTAGHQPESARGRRHRRRQPLVLFRRVLWPLLMPTTIFVLVNAVINAFRMVDHVVVMTRGGPDNATTTASYHLYEVGSSSGIRLCGRRHLVVC